MINNPILIRNWNHFRKINLNLLGLIKQMCIKDRKQDLMKKKNLCLPLTPSEKNKKFLFRKSTRRVLGAPTTYPSSFNPLPALFEQHVSIWFYSQLRVGKTVLVFCAQMRRILWIVSLYNMKWYNILIRITM